MSSHHFENFISAVSFAIVARSDRFAITIRLPSVGLSSESVMRILSPLQLALSLISQIAGYLQMLY